MENPFFLVDDGFASMRVCSRPCLCQANVKKQSDIHRKLPIKEGRARKRLLTQKLLFTITITCVVLLLLFTTIIIVVV